MGEKIHGKFRIYVCPGCNGKCHRPLSRMHTNHEGEFPKPCDRCGESLKNAQFSIMDSALWWRQFSEGLK